MTQSQNTDNQKQVTRKSTLIGNIIAGLVSLSFFGEGYGYNRQKVSDLVRQTAALRAENDLLQKDKERLKTVE